MNQKVICRKTDESSPSKLLPGRISQGHLITRLAEELGRIFSGYSVTGGEGIFKFAELAKIYVARNHSQGADFVIKEDASLTMDCDQVILLLPRESQAQTFDLLLKRAMQLLPEPEFSRRGALPVGILLDLFRHCEQLGDLRLGYDCYRFDMDGINIDYLLFFNPSNSTVLGVPLSISA